MSDGNFHRNLLPSHGYASGVRAGRAAQTQRALELVAQLLEERTELTAEERQAFVRALHARLTGQK